MHPERGATAALFAKLFGKEFQFTHPGRGATSLNDEIDLTVEVSIHAPREGCD